MSSFANALYWGLGLLVALMSVGPFDESIIAGLLMLVAAGLLLPNIRNIFFQFTKISIPTKVRMVSVILLIIASFTIMMVMKSEKEEAIRQKFASNKEQILVSVKDNLKTGNLDGAQNICFEYIPVNDPEFDKLCDTVYQEVKNSNTKKAEAAQLEAISKAEAAQAQQEAEAAQAIEAVPLISAGALLQAFTNNTIRANDEYQGKKIRIQGVVDVIGGESGQIGIVLSGGNEFSGDGIQCNFDDKNEITKIKNINKGNTVTVLGTVDSIEQVDGLRKNVMVTRCSLL